uniref:TLC domain containing 1 n=1 Tax=Apteryx owenii TaxID=8824 RepID=A0A8B9S6Q9_APTOW
MVTRPGKGGGHPGVPPATEALPGGALTRKPLFPPPGSARISPSRPEPGRGSSRLHGDTSGARYGGRGLWQSSELLADIQDGYCVSGHLLVCFSSGYFIHDSLDIILSHQSRSSWEYLVHHAMAISAFISLIITGRFLVAAMLLLLVEVSNIFLTTRMLLKMSNVPSPVLYEVNKYVNLVMYFAFRLAPQAYLTWYFLRYVEVQGQGAFLMANLLLLDAMILMYFSRLLRSDFFPSLHKASAGRDVDGEKFLID